MKKEVMQYVKLLGGTTMYSGKRKLMFINEPFILENVLNPTIEDMVLQKFGYSLKFKIQTLY